MAWRSTELLDELDVVEYYRSNDVMEAECWNCLDAINNGLSTVTLCLSPHFFLD